MRPIGLPAPALTLHPTMNSNLRFPVLLIALSLSGCASNRLHEYDFADRTLSVVTDVPRRPDVLTGGIWPTITGDPVQDFLRTGATVVREVEARAVRERVDAASRRVDVGRVFEDGAAERAARYLAADLVAPRGGEDFTLELSILEYGIDAEEWDATAYYYVEAEATLLDATDGSEIWRRSIDASDPVGPEIYGESSVRSVVTAAVLADLTVDEIALAFEELGDYAARVVTEELRDALRKARSRDR